MGLEVEMTVVVMAQGLVERLEIQMEKRQLRVEHQVVVVQVVEVVVVQEVVQVVLQAVDLKLLTLRTVVVTDE